MFKKLEYSVARIIDRLVPSAAVKPLRDSWRQLRGNPEVNVARYLCDRSRLAVDIGAHSGSFTHDLAQYSAGCEAFEANPILASLLEENCKGEAVRIHSCALSDREQQTELIVPSLDGNEFSALGTIEPENNFSGVELRKFTVSCYPLDSFNFPPVGFIKIDVEGHELAVIKGAQLTIERDRPSFLIEAEERHKPGSVENLLNYFSNCGYEGFFLLGRQILPVNQFNLARHQSASSIKFDKIIPGKTYANNFIFTKNQAAIAKWQRV
ncbi:FkbM family methyltransferase [Microcoleus sp. herbarium14]|uniref:FkbM family methyltransferase n=1 Tax=Microcoleus sp. herbarium14 TaxID=3055439 RepID=UPI002FD728B0